MLQTSVLGLVIGSIFAKYVHLFWIATGSMIVIIWIGFLHSIIGHSILHAAREAMMIGATQAGLAFSNSSVALVHGMSRPIGAHFHVPHGLSNAMLLPAITRFSITHTITGSNAWVAALVLMAFAEVIVRLAVLRLRASCEGRKPPAPDRYFDLSHRQAALATL